MEKSERRAVAGGFWYAVCAGGVYAVAYALLLGFSSYMHGLAGFSLWFPAAGIRFALIFVFGWRFGFIAAVAEICVQGLLDEWAIWGYQPHFIIAGIAAPPLIYAAIIGFLQKHRLTDGSFRDFSHVLWFCVAAVAAPSITAPVSAYLQIEGGRLVAEAFQPAVLSFWIGDMIGLFMLGPISMILLSLIAARKQPPFENLKIATFAVEFTLAVIFIWLAAQFAESTALSLRWLPFLIPVIAISLRYGFVGAALIVLALNVVIVGKAIELQGYARVDLQAFLAAVSFVGLLVGGLMTAKRRSKEALARQFKTLAHLDRMNTMGEMAAHIIHELAQPIHATSLYAQGAVKMLEQGELDREGLLDAINMAASETSRTQELIRRMKAFARKGELALEETTAQEIIVGISHMIEIAAKQQGVRVKYDLSDTPLKLTVDVIQIQQAILNLVRNSIEAMENKSTKTLTIEVNLTGQGKTYIKIADTGPGLPDGLNGLIGGETTKKNGMGVGLKIVETIVEAHDGTFQHNKNSATINL